MFRDLEKEVDSLRSGLYKNYEPRIREMTPVDLSKETAGAAVVVRTNSSFQPSTGAGAGVLSGLPAAVPAASGAPVSRPPLTLGQECFAMRGSVLQAWSRATVVEAKPGPAEYRVRLEGRGQVGSEQAVLQLDPLHCCPDKARDGTAGSLCGGLPGPATGGAESDRPVPGAAHPARRLLQRHHCRASQDNQQTAILGLLRRRLRFLYCPQGRSCGERAVV